MLGRGLRDVAALADGADLIFTTIPCELVAANIAEHYDIPLTSLHYYPVHPNGQLIPAFPVLLNRSAMTVSRWLMWLMNKTLEDAHVAN